MPCNAGYNWCHDKEVVYNDGDKEYCVFHAPQGKKGCDLRTFNRKIHDILESSNQIDLSGTIFEGDISFEKFDINQPLPSMNLQFAAINGTVDFSYCVFNGDSDFQHAHFKSSVIFLSSQFVGNVQFFRTIFDGEAIFQGAKFRKAIFDYATFNEVAAFEIANYKLPVSFQKTTFNGDAVFSGINFNGRVDFRNANFNSNVSFENTLFNKTAHFDWARFGSNVSENITRFRYAKFLHEVTFGLCEFNCKTDFTRAQLGTNIEFHETEFNGIADFSYVKFQKALFYGKVFSDEALFANTIIENNVKFQNTNLKKASFRESDIRSCDFITCHWEEWGNRYVLYDEAYIKSKEDVKMIRHIESLYRAQKHKSKQNHNEFDYSRWHLSEKEMLRKRTRFKDNPFYCAILNLYCCLSGYGEEPIRAGLWLFIFIESAFWLLGLSGLKPLNNNTHNIVNILNMSYQDAWTHLLNTLELLMFRKPKYYIPAGISGSSFKLLFQILLPIQTTLFILSLRNRFRR